MQFLRTHLIARVSLTIAVWMLIPLVATIIGVFALDMSIDPYLLGLLVIATVAAAFACMEIIFRELYPVTDISLALEAYAQRREQVPLGHAGDDEVGRLAAAARWSVDEIESLLADLRKQAVTDPQTGLPNREAFTAALSTERSALLAILDIDGLKSINDVHGHEVGDAVLRDVGTALCKSLRSADMVARWGGAAFAVLLRRSCAVEAIEAMNRARKAVEARAILPGHRVTVSAGLVQMSGDTERDLLLAGRALNEAKEAGRNRVVFAPPSSSARAPAAPSGPMAWTRAEGTGVSGYLN